MSEASTAATRRLGELLGGRAWPPGTAEYAAALGRVFFPDAARRQPACIVAPASAREVSSVLQIAGAAGCPVTVRGGGLSATCVADGAIMIDLSAELGHARLEGGTVVAGGGATVGTMLGALAPAGATLPVGIAGMAGLGLATRGGVGFLTRSMGLTVDHLTSVQIVLASGEVAHVSEHSTGPDADLWWAVRGCAPSFGVVTSATFRARAARPRFVDRMVVAPDALAAYFEIAPGLPRHTSMSAVLGTVPGAPGQCGLLVYTVCASEAAADADAARRATAAVAARSASPVLFRREQTGMFRPGFPDMALPFADGREPAPIPPPAPGPRTGVFFGKSAFLDATPGADLAAALTGQLRRAPTPACRIDFQHTGGALGDVADAGTAFWGRGAEWNAPVNAIAAGESQRDECLAWARETVAAFAPHAVGGYAVELRPGFPETGREVEAAYGGNLPRLRELAGRYDPAGVFGRYVPLRAT